MEVGKQASSNEQRDVVAGLAMEAEQARAAESHLLGPTTANGIFKD